MTTEEMIAVLKAKQDGKAVEYQQRGADGWRPHAKHLLCDFTSHNYRVSDKWAEVKAAWKAGKPVERLNNAVHGARWVALHKCHPEHVFDLPEMSFRIKPDPFAKYKEAYKQGKNVQWLDGEVWKDIEQKGWYFDSPKGVDTKYRIVTKKVVPWTIDEVPVGAVIKNKLTKVRGLITTVSTHPSDNLPILVSGVRWWGLDQLMAQFDVCDACGKVILGPCGTEEVTVVNE